MEFALFMIQNRLIFQIGVFAVLVTASLYCFPLHWKFNMLHFIVIPCNCYSDCYQQHANDYCFVCRFGNSRYHSCLACLAILVLPFTWCIDWQSDVRITLNVIYKYFNGYCSDIGSRIYDSHGNTLYVLLVLKLICVVIISVIMILNFVGIMNVIYW